MGYAARWALRPSTPNSCSSWVGRRDGCWPARKADRARCSSARTPASRVICSNRRCRRVCPRRGGHPAARTHADPAIAYLTRTLHAQAGIVISASHNPYYDNGIKFFSAQGNKLADELELAIEAELGKPMFTVDSAELGKAERVRDAAGRYIEFCKSTIPSTMEFRGMKIVVDCAHGATYHIAPACSKN